MARKQYKMLDAVLTAVIVGGVLFGMSYAFQKLTGSSATPTTFFTVPVPLAYTPPKFP